MFGFSLRCLKSKKALGIHLELSNCPIYLHKEKIVYSSLDDGKITLFTELIKNIIPPVLPKLGYFLYLLMEVGSAVPFPKSSAYCFYKTETRNFFKGHDSHSDSSPTERFCLAGKYPQNWQSDSPNLEKI